MRDPRAQKVVVATFRRYEDAERECRDLAKHRAPLERTSILAREMRRAEHVTGRFDSWAAAGHGAVSGAAAGGLVALLLAVFGEATAGPLLLFWGALVGAAVGALVGLAGHARSRRAASTPYFQAGRFDLVAEAAVAEQVARLLRADRRAA